MVTSNERYEAKKRLKRDASNRAQRTLVQSLYLDLGVAIAVFILSNINSIDVTSREAMLALGLSFLKSLLTAGASYVVRMYGDKSRIYTGPLPPEDPGPPKEEYDEFDTGNGQNQPLVDADANVRMLQAQIDLQKAQEDRAEHVEEHQAETARRAEAVAEVMKKRAPRKVPAKRVTPLETLRAEAKTPVKKAPAKKAAPRKKTP